MSENNRSDNLLIKIICAFAAGVCAGFYAEKMRKKLRDAAILQRYSEQMKIDSESGAESAKGSVFVVSADKEKGKEYAKNELLRMSGSYVINDPGGKLARQFWAILFANGYNIKILNLAKPEVSVHYNPFNYIRGKVDIENLAGGIISNTTADDEYDCSYIALRHLLCAYIAYIYYEAPEHEQTLDTLAILSRSLRVAGDDEDEEYDVLEDDEDDLINDDLVADTTVDFLFNKLKEEHPTHFAVQEYEKFKKEAGGSKLHVMRCCGRRLLMFSDERFVKLAADDGLALDRLGEEKTALFVVTPRKSDDHNVMAAILYSQLLEIITNAADANGGKTPYSVRCILNECEKIGVIENLPSLIMKLRRFNVYASIITNNAKEFQKIYGDFAESIVNYCDKTEIIQGETHGD